MRKPPKTSPQGHALRIAVTPGPRRAWSTLDEAPTGTFNICEVCVGEDDRVQFHDLDYRAAQTRSSLNQARRNFREHGVSETRFTAYVRPPLPEERP